MGTPGNLTMDAPGNLTVAGTASSTLGHHGRDVDLPSTMDKQKQAPAAVQQDDQPAGAGWSSLQPWN